MLKRLGPVLALALVTVLLGAGSGQAEPDQHRDKHPGKHSATSASKRADQPANKQAGKKAGKHQRCKTKRHPHRKACPAKKHVWSPKDASTFNYPFAGKKSRERIRTRVLHAIQGSPKGSQIRLAVFTFVDRGLASALIAAQLRGVSVQLVVNRSGIAVSPPYHRLARTFGHNLRGKDRTAPAKASFAKSCSFSCRGTHGNLHTKIFLFSQVGHARWVSMVGSANLTSKATDGQWNTMDTVVDKATYGHLLREFNQLKRDRVPAQPYDWFRSPRSTGWIFPRPVRLPVQDPMVRALRSIECKAPGQTGKAFKLHLTKKQKKHHHKRFVRRTMIRISMYAWFDRRGNYLAREVRRKWNQGCDVRIIYAVTNGLVKKTLYNPTGRGRIPMRRAVRIDPLTDEVVDYSHSKYVAVSGGYAGKPTEAVWTGSMNFTGLGVFSDDIIVRLNGHRLFRDYLSNFRKVWGSPHAQVPLPTAGLDRMRVLADPQDAHPVLGEGSLSAFEDD